MSYCRWSSDGFRSDVYVYEDCMGGWTTHVARARRLGLDTLPQSPYDYDLLKAMPKEWQDIYKAYHEALGKLEMVPIVLPHVGETFSDPTPGACAERLLMLRELGYYVPQYAIDDLQEEQRNSGQEHDG